MRKSCKTLIFIGVVAATAVFAGTALHAGDDDEDQAATQKLAQEALDKAISRGKELFHSKDIGKKSCAACHENPEKPQLSLPSRQFAYPAFSKKKKAIVTMGQKINEMLTARSGAAKEMDLSSADIIAIEAYIVSVKKK